MIFFLVAKSINVLIVSVVGGRGWWGYDHDKRASWARGKTQASWPVFGVPIIL